MTENGENGQKEPEPNLWELQRSPGSGTIRPETKETPPPDSIITTEAPPSIIESPLCDSLLALDRSPSISPNLSLSSRSPSSSPSLSINSNTPPPLQPRPQKTHCFLEYVFRRPTVCQQCKQMITGTFKRNFSSPLLTNDLLTVVKEPAPTHVTRKGAVDPVYEALRYGTSLAQMSRTTFNTISESPCQQREEEQEKLDSEHVAEEECGAESEVAVSENEKSEIENKLGLQPLRRIELRAIHTYVVLYKFLPQEKNDLELQPGDRVQVIDDSNEDWWKRLRPGERVWKVTQGFHGNREKGQMTVKELQICVGKAEETDGFYKLTSGKKRGLVPCSCVVEI
ncbi:SH3 and cysteine-rich domain-containing protein 2 [Bagarius yarrelli]|uniref:SH3 and cysteine-rich domain-containing protein 2 n=1 Tax=Bagarius yarrelli TaxID=175774 RepID=A0A556U113_BAGYA|nr:SH3 and cysteine-rich domain-containing protein 2 [Bagarius yarrelli]